MKHPALSLGLCLCASLAAAAEFDAWFGDGMVLQRGQPIRVLGTAQPNSRITLRLGDQTAETQADADGRWRQTFARSRMCQRLSLSAARVGA